MAMFVLSELLVIWRLLVPMERKTDFMKRTNIHKPTAMGLLRQLKGAGILKELRQGSGRRAAVLCFPELLNIAEGRIIV